tara:strand:+ start:891 stop:1202 length:312 start_codon:yes stop_codon:yes gene_type:complete
MTTTEEKTAKLTQFIVDNELNFDDTGSGLNGACVILCGYALHIDPEEKIDASDVVNAVDKSFIKIPKGRDQYMNEIDRVFYYAENNNYGEWWKSPDASKQYKF